MQRILRHIGRRWAAAKWAALKATRATVTIPTRQGVLTVSTRDNVIGRQLYIHREYQLDLATRVTEFLRQRGWIGLRGQGTVLDIGANIGFISIGMLVAGEFANGIGVEPDPTNFQLCQRNVQHNQLAGRYTALAYAVSDRDSQLQFALSRNNFGDHQIQSAPGSIDAHRDRQVISVHARPIDAILSELPAEVTDKIALVWIDVQGQEGFVMGGGAKLFARSIPVVAEIWPIGLKQSGMGVDRFCEIASGYWSHFWVWRRCGRFVQYPITELHTFCEELGDTGEFDDVIFYKLGT